MNELDRVNDLDRLNELCADLGVTISDGQMLAWANACDPVAVPDVVFDVISNIGLLSDGGPPAVPSRRRQRISLPADADALWELLWEVDEPTAIGVLTDLAASARSSRPRRSLRSQGRPEDVFAEIGRLTGPGSRWWTNTDLTNWNPVTQHTFDAVVVCAGNGLAVTIVAFEGEGG